VVVFSVTGDLPVACDRTCSGLRCY